MGELSDFEIGQTVELNDDRTGVVQYAGSTQFAPGEWIGIVLDDATGKNDGTVQGQRYFDCLPGHGMFVRPGAIKATDEATPKPKERSQMRANGITLKARPQSMIGAGSKRQSIADPRTTKRQSINAGSPTPGANGTLRTRLGSPSKSPTKQLSSTGSSTAVSQTTTPLSTPMPSAAGNRTSRLSMAAPALPASKAPRPSIAGTLNGSTRTSSNGSIPGSRAPANRMSLRPAAISRLSSAGGTSQCSVASGRTSPPDSLDEATLSPPLGDLKEEEINGPLSAAMSKESAQSMVESSQLSSSGGRSPRKPASRAPAPSARELEDLKTKLRVMEKKRVDDREKLKALDKVQAERDKFEGIIQKLQTKYQPQQQEMTELKKRIKEEEEKAQAIESVQIEHDIVMESATLDREMAEETAEALRTELDALRQKHEEIMLEIEILREENQELGQEISPEEKTSQGWLQMERSNERLREALMRLRDITQQQEADLRDQVAELESDLQDLSGIKDDCLRTKESLAQSETAIEDLRQQLDTALGAEEMIEELTEKNMALTQQIDDLKTAVEDLESLKEINDELEINHTETEKQMQDEIDYGESLLTDQKRKAASQDETIQDLEYTVNRFRDLVANMQSDLEDMRASQQITETEANELTSRSKAMMDINMKLQVSASKAQTKAIDVELGKLEAQESREHLAIVTRFLPETFETGTERNSVLAYLRFQRIHFKANLMHGVIKDKVNGQPTKSHEDDVFACCDLMDQLIWVRGMCDRFISFVQSCTSEAFEKLASALYDLEPVERAFTAWIEHLKKDDLKERHCVEELQRSIALMTHLAEVHITEGLEQRAQDIHMRTLMLQSHLEGAAAVLSYTKSMAQQKAAPLEEEEEQDQHAGQLLRKADDLISQMRSAKVTTSKAIRNLEDLKARSLTLDQSTMPLIEQTELSASDLASSSRDVGLSVFKLLNEEGRNTPYSYAEIINATSNSDSSPFSSVAPSLATAINHIQTFSGLTSSLAQTVEIPSPPPPPPWQLLAQKLKQQAAASSSQVLELARLQSDMSDKNTALAMREKVVEEMSVKVEVLENRVNESNGRREKMRELEIANENARSNEKELNAKVTRLQQDLRSLENERDTLKASAAAMPASVNGNAAALPQTAPSANTVIKIQDLETQISTLESTIRYLRRQTHAQNIDSSLSFLSEPLIPPTPASKSLLQSEARDVLKEMLHLVSQPENQMVKLKVPMKEDRLKWRPVKQTMQWQYDWMKEEWEGWREWQASVSRRGNARADGRKKPLEDEGTGRVLAKMQVNLPEMKGLMKGVPKQVRIVRPEEWEDLEGLVGVG